MATITTNSTGKKKLVYKQDPDGVFRLKKLNPEDDNRKDDKTVNDYVNELVSCTYEVVDPNKPPEPPKSQSNSNPKTRSVSPDIHDLESLPNDHDLESMKSHDFNFAKSKKTTNKSPISPNTSGDFEAMDTHDSFHSPVVEEPAKLHKMFNSVSYNLPIFHIPSFALGIIVAFVLHKLSPLIMHYSVIIFNYAKVGLVWALILGVIAWYSGVIKVQDVSSIRSFSENLMARILGKVKPPQDGHHVDHNILNENHEDIEDPMSEPELEPEPEFHDYVDEPSPPHERHERHGRPGRRPVSTSPVRQSMPPRKNTLTSVMPYRPSLRNEASNRNTASVPDLFPMGSDKKSAPKLNNRHTTDPRFRSRSIEKPQKRLPPIDVNYGRSHHRPSSSFDLLDHPGVRPSPVKHSYHETNGNEELPFINEVKLVSQNDPDPNDSPEDDYVPNLPSHNYQHYGNNVKRLNSALSKKSVLGTRANYNKFLENAQNYDYD